jgi:hypothetical protein
MKGVDEKKKMKHNFPYDLKIKMNKTKKHAEK